MPETEALHRQLAAESTSSAELPPAAPTIDALQRALKDLRRVRRRLVATIHSLERRSPDSSPPR